LRKRILGSKTFMRSYFILVFAVALTTLACAQKSMSQEAAHLRRRAQVGVRLQMHASLPLAVVSNVETETPAEKSGLRVGDRVMAINDQAIPDSYALQSAVQKIRGGDRVTFIVMRGTSVQSFEIAFTPSPMPLETHANLSLEATQLTNDYGDRLRVLITKPTQSQGKLPAILFVSWLSCSTVEDRGAADSWSRMMRDVAAGSGAVMLRLEKPGVGDSQGPPCSSCDLVRELNGYQAALRYLKARNDVDTTRLLIFGGSLGGTLSAVVGEGHRIKGYVAAVSVYKTWLEHMIELERRRLFFAGQTQQQISALMPGYIAFHTAYLEGKMTPAEVQQANPQLRSLWYDDPAHQYGRPAAFYHQVQAINFMEKWHQVNAPVLVVAGGYDWIMTLQDNHMLVDELNRRSPGSATLLVGGKMDHHWKRYGSAQAAFDETGGEYDSETVTKMVEWIRAVLK